MKFVVVGIVAWLAYWLGLIELFYWLNRRAKRILTFHNVLPDELFIKGIANGVSNRLSDFEKIIDECSRRFRVSTDILDANTITITFDDGYKNQYTTAFKSLRVRGIPAYIFVSGECLAGRSLCVDLLTHWISGVPQGRYVCKAPLAREIEINDKNRSRIWSKILWPAFLADADNFGKNVIDACDGAYSIERILAELPCKYREERLTGVTREQCCEMRKVGWKVGWHTKSHYPLKYLDSERLKRELDAPEEFRDTCFSYPYGNSAEVGDFAIEIVRSYGYPCAVSNTNIEAANKSLYFLPRMSLPVGRHRLHFRLSGLEYFIKHRRLLPIVEEKFLKEVHLHEQSDSVRRLSS